jgi:2-keto-3-deoxy-L-rhamnonate aldolase RhmA
MNRTITSAGVFVMLALGASLAQAQVGPNFDPADWQYGARYVTDGEVPIWNPVMQKIKNGEPVIGGTIRATDPRTYCSMAGAGYDFLWIEMQHEAMTWEQVSRMWLACPGPAVPGVRIAHESEGNVQKPVDMGALVIVVPTVDSVEEAKRAVAWTYFPPMGRRSNGGGQAFSRTMWGEVPGGYRATWNENVVLILMIETLEGVRNAREIAKIPGVDGLFAASGDLGNFSGYREGDPEYEMLITEVVEAAQEAGKIACGPLRWMGTRPDFMCFQAGTEGANIRRGAQAEIQAANQRFADAPERPRIAGVLANLTADCGEIVYEADCLNAVREAAGAAGDLSAPERQGVRTRLMEIIADNPSRAARIREVAAEAGLPLERR